MTRDFDTNLGLFSFDPNGEAIYEPVMLIVKDGTVLRTDVGSSCGCGVEGVQTGVSPPGVSIDVIEDAIKDTSDMIASQCRCGLGIKDESDAGLSTKQRKAILEQGLKLLERDANLQSEAGEDDAGRAGESEAQ